MIGSQIIDIKYKVNNQLDFTLNLTGDSFT